MGGVERSGDGAGEIHQDPVEFKIASVVVDPKSNSSRIVDDAHNGSTNPPGWSDPLGRSEP